MSQIVDWYDRYLKYSPIQARAEHRAEEVVYLDRPESGG